MFVYNLCPVEREYRPDENRKRNEEEGIIEQYERYRYGGNDNSTPQYNDIGSERSIEELANEPDDIDGTLNHTGGELLDESSLPKMAWEYDYSRGDPLADDWDYGVNKINQHHLVNKSTEEKLVPESEELLLAQGNLDTKQEEQSAPLNVAELSAAEKLGEAMKKAALKLPKAVGEQLLAMVNPGSLAVMVGVLGAYAASHAVGIGVIADAAMAVGAGLTIGWQAVSAAKDLWGFAQFINATTEEDLDKAGQHLANFITTVGMDIVIGILFKKAAGKAKNYAEDLRQVDEVSAHSDDVANSSRVNGVDNTNQNQIGEVQHKLDTDVVESNIEERPPLLGSGPFSGVIEISSRTSSTGALKNYYPKTGSIEFVFDPSTNTFVVGQPNGKYPGFRTLDSGHQRLVYSSGLEPNKVVGGMFSRLPDGTIKTTENSGHYGKGWSESIRKAFIEFLESQTDIKVQHEEWNIWD